MAIVVAVAGSASSFSADANDGVDGRNEEDFGVDGDEERCFDFDIESMLMPL